MPIENPAYGQSKPFYMIAVFTFEVGAACPIGAFIFQFERLVTVALSGNFRKRVLDGNQNTWLFLHSAS